jgi:hypothetical protein
MADSVSVKIKLVTVARIPCLTPSFFFFFWLQIPDAEDHTTDSNPGGSSNSLSTLDAVEKQSEPRNSSLGQVTEMMVF